jgi:hypothetical protein
MLHPTCTQTQGYLISLFLFFQNTESGLKKYEMKCFRIYTLQKLYYKIDRIKEEEMGGACSRHEKGELDMYNELTNSMELLLLLLLLLLPLLLLLYLSQTVSHCIYRIEKAQAGGSYLCTMNASDVTL